MFDIGSGEVLVIAVVAIIVLGPETCVKYAQKAGVVMRKVQKEWAQTKKHFDDVDLETQARKSENLPPKENNSSKTS